MWLPIALFGYFLNAIAAIIDKALLTKSVPNPKVYAFFISILGLIAFVAAPFGLSIPSIQFLLLSLLTGGLSVLALVSFFTALQKGEASRVVPIVGGVQPIIILALSRIFLGEQLLRHELLAFGLLILGGIIISYDQTEHHSKTSQWVGWALLSGGFYGFFYILTKYLFLNASFIDGFLWPRLGAGVIALFLLLDPITRKSLKTTSENSGKGGKLAFIIGQTSGASSFLFINYAIAIGSVSLVNAMQGSQYAFVFILTLVLSKRISKLLSEKITPMIITQKVAAILLIMAGIFLLGAYK